MLPEPPSADAPPAALAAVPPDPADAADADDAECTSAVQRAAATKKRVLAHRRAVAAILSGALHPDDGHASGDPPSSPVDEAPFFIDARRDGFPVNASGGGPVCFKDVYPEFLIPLTCIPGEPLAGDAAEHFRATLECGNNLTAFVATVDVNTLGLSPYLSDGVAAAHAGLKPVLEDENQHPLMDVDRHDVHYAAEPCRATSVKVLERHMSQRHRWMSGRCHAYVYESDADVTRFLRLEPLDPHMDGFRTNVIDRSEADVLAGLMLARALTRDSLTGPTWGGGAVKLLFDASSKDKLRDSVRQSLALLYTVPVECFFDKKGQAHALGIFEDEDIVDGRGGARQTLLDGDNECSCVEGREQGEAPMPQPVFRLYIEPDASEGAPRMHDSVNGFHWRQRLYALPPAAFRALMDELKRHDLLDEFPMLARLVGTRDKHYLDLHKEDADRLKDLAKEHKVLQFLPPLATFSPAGVKKIEDDPADLLNASAAPAWEKFCAAVREDRAFRDTWVRRRTAWQPHGVRYLTREGAEHLAAQNPSEGFDPDQPWLANDTTFRRFPLAEREVKLPELFGGTWGKLRSLDWLDSEGARLSREAVQDMLVGEEEGGGGEGGGDGDDRGDDDSLPVLFRYHMVQLRSRFPEELNGRTLPMAPIPGKRLHDFVQWASDNWLRQSTIRPGRVVFTDGGLSPYPVNLKHLQGLLEQRTEQRDRYKRTAEELTGELTEVRKRLCTAETETRKVERTAQARQTALRLGQGHKGQPRHATAYFSGDLCQLRVLGRGGKLVARHGDSLVPLPAVDAGSNGFTEFAICFLPDLSEPGRLVATRDDGSDPWTEPARDGSDSEREDD